MKEQGTRTLSAGRARLAVPPRQQQTPSTRTAGHGRTLGLLFGCWLAFFWPLITPLTSSRMFIVDGDFTRQFLMFHSFSAQELWSGRLPLWNPYIFAGHPFVADIQTAVFYPFGLLTTLAFGADGITQADLQLRVVVAYLLSLVFTYALAFRLTGNRAAAAATAIVFTFGSYLTSYPMQQMAILETAIWLPLGLLAVDWASDRCLAWSRLAVVSLVLAAATLAGHPQTILFIAFTITGYGVYRRAADERAQGKRWPV